MAKFRQWPTQSAGADVHRPHQVEPPFPDLRPADHAEATLQARHQTSQNHGKISVKVRSNCSQGF